MDTFYLILLILLLANMVAAMGRVFRGPSRADRLMTMQLFGTTGVAILLLLAEWQNQPALRDTALLFVVLAVLIVLALVRKRPGNAPEVSRPPLHD